MNRRWILQHRPKGEVQSNDLALVKLPIDELEDGEVLIRNIYLSLDPTHRIWMSDRDQYMPPVEIGAPMRGGVLGVVEASRSAKFKPGDIVSPGLAAWESFSIAPETQIRLIPTRLGLPLTAYMSVLGASGLTAYFGMNDIVRPRSGETIVVTAAAGSVGSIACQIAKLRGATVVGIAGGQKKCAWLIQHLGIDGAIDYKNEEVGAALDRLCPRGIDADFENVGGKIMDAVFSRLNNFGRLALCGLISTYNSAAPVTGPTDFSSVLMRRLEIRGFLISDYFPRAREAYTALADWVASGKIQWQVEVIDGLENALDGLGRLFTGNHHGKLLVKISDEPSA
jgi:NADPH-dependent curcumin reductase